MDLVLEEFFPEQSGKNQCQLTMPVADFELRILWRREAWKQVQRRIIKEKGKSILQEETKGFWLISLSRMTAQQDHNHSM